MNWFPDPMQQRLVLVLVHFVWQGVVLATLAAGLLAGLRKSRPVLRYASLLVAFGLLMASPVVTWCLLPESAVLSLTSDAPRITTGSDTTDSARAGLSAGRGRLVDPKAEATPHVQLSVPGDVTDAESLGRLPVEGTLSHAPIGEHGPRTTASKGPTELHHAPAIRVTAGRTARSDPDKSETRQVLASAGSSVVEWLKPYRHWIVGGWLGGVLLLSVRLLLGVVGTTRWRRETEFIPESLQSIVRQLSARMRMHVPIVRATRRVSEAVVVGLLKPMVLLPATWVTELPTDMLEAVIAHELAHLRRFDLWVNLLQRVVETLLFYHPVVWWLSRRIRIEREMCCDELAVQATDDRVGYAAALEHVARLRLSQQSAAPLALAMTGRRRGLLLERVQSLLNGDSHEPPGTRRIAGAVTLGVAALLVGVAWFGATLTEGMASQRERPEFADKAPTPAEREDAPKLRILNADGSRALINSVVNARFGYPGGRSDETERQRYRPWTGFRDRYGIVSLEKLPAGDHIVVAGASFPNRTAFKLTMPSSDVVVEQRLRALRPWTQPVRKGRTTRDAHSFTARVETDDDRSEFIVLTLINHDTKPLVIEPEDLSLTDINDYRVLSPLLKRRISDGPREEDNVVVPAGETVEVKLQWEDWVRHGLWVSRHLEAISEPWSGVSIDGKRQVRVNVRNSGTIPVLVTDPQIILSAYKRPTDGQPQEPELRVTAPDGSDDRYSLVQVAHLGYQGNPRAQPEEMWPALTWHARPTGGLVPLKNLPNGRHLLVVKSDFGARHTAFRVTMPPAKRVVEQRLPAAAEWVPPRNVGQVYKWRYDITCEVESKKDGAEFLVISATNRDDEPLVIEDDDVSLATFGLWNPTAKLLQSGNFGSMIGRVLAPSLAPRVWRLDEWRLHFDVPESSRKHAGQPSFGSSFRPVHEGSKPISDDPSRTRVEIPPGATGTIRIDWTEWVRRGLWIDRHDEISEIWPAALEPGEILIRVNVRLYDAGTLSANHPQLVLNQFWADQRADQAAVAEAESDPASPKTELETTISRAVDDAIRPPKNAGTSEPVEEVTVNDDSSIDDLIKALRGEDIYIRGAAIVQLGKRGAKAAPAAELIVDQMQYTIKKVRSGVWTSPLDSHAERTLQLIGSDTLPAIRKGLNHESHSVRKNCAMLIGRFAGPSFPDTTIADAATIARLIELLGDPDDPERGVAGAASTALKNIGLPDPTAEEAATFVTDPLLKTLKDGLTIPVPKKEWKNGEQPNPQDPLTKTRQRRNYAAGLLGHLADSRAIKPLLAALDSKDRMFGRWAGDALGRMRTAACEEILSNEATVQRLIDFCRSDDVWIRGDMMQALRFVKKGSRGPIVAALDDDDIRVRLTMLRAWFTFVDDTRIIPILLRRMGADSGDSDPDHGELQNQERASQISTLSRYLDQIDNQDEVLPLLIDVLDHESANVRVNAASAIGRVPKAWLADARVMSSLLDALKTHADYATRSAVIHVLQRLKDERAVVPLIEMVGQDELFDEYSNTPRQQTAPKTVKEYDDRLRKAICDTLGELGDKRAIAALRVRKGLNEPWVLEALGKLGDVSSTPELIAQLKSDSHDARLAAAKALQGTPDAQHIDALSAALDRVIGGMFTNRNIHSKRQLAGEIAKALAATGDSRVAEILIVATRHGGIWRMDYRGQGYHPDLRQRTDDDPLAGPLMSMGAVAIPALVHELTLPDQATVQASQPDASARDSNNDVPDDDGDQPATRGAATGNGETAADQATKREYSTRWSREVAAWALSQMKIRGHATNADLMAAEAALLASLKRDGEKGLQLHAGRTLGNLKTKAAIPEMVRILTLAAEKSAGLTDADIAKRKNGPHVAVFAPPPDTPTDEHFYAAELAESTARMLSWMSANTPETRVAMEPLLSHGVAAVRESAIFGTLSSDHPRTAELITPLLTDPMSNVRQAAARQLGFTGARAAVPKLVELISTEQSRGAPKPRRQNGSNSGQRDPRLDVFAMAAQALGMLSNLPGADSSDGTDERTQKAAGDAVFSLRSIDDDRLQGHVIMSLVQMQDTRGVDELRKVMSSDDARLRAAVMTRASFLAMFASHGWGAKISNSATREILRENAENDPSSRVRLYGPGSLRGFSDDDTIRSLVAICDDEDDHIRTWALTYLLQSTHSVRFEMLKQFLSDKSPQCRSAATGHYADLHSPGAESGEEPPENSELPEGAPTVLESVSLVAPLLSDSAADVRESALKSLARLLPLNADARIAHIETIRRMSTDDAAPKVRHRARRVLSLLSALTAPD